MSKEMFGANQASCRLLRFNHCTVHTDSFVTIDIIITIVLTIIVIATVTILFIMADHRYDRFRVTTRSGDIDARTNVEQWKWNKGKINQGEKRRIERKRRSTQNE